MSTYYKALGEILYSGTQLESRVGPMVEKLGTEVSVFLDALPRRPKMRRELGYMELCQFLLGTYEPTLISRVAPNVDMSLFGRSAIYGPRVRFGRDQLADVIQELKHQENSRRAVITISAPHEPLEDQPCISMLQFFNREGAVHMLVTARSWDMWFGAPHDLVVLSGLLQVVASCTIQKVGILTVKAGSAHIYKRSIETAQYAFDHGLLSTWSYQLPNLGDLTIFRQWADSVAYDENWLSGPPAHVKERWEKR